MKNGPRRLFVPNSAFLTREFMVGLLPIAVQRGSHADITVCAAVFRDAQLHLSCSPLKEVRKPRLSMRSYSVHHLALQ